MNKIFALPTQSTLDLLQTAFSGSSFSVNWDALCLELGSSTEMLKPSPEGQYRAITGPLGVWYDQATAKSYLILPIIPSPEMCDRHDEIGDAWGRTFVPYVVILEDPLLRRERKAFINSVASRFVDYPLMLTFHNEIVLTDNSVVPDHAEFYEDYKTRGQIPVQVFIENTVSE